MIRSIQLLRTPNPTTLVHRSAAAPSTRPNLNRPVAAARAGPVDHRMRVVGPRHPLRPSRLWPRDPYFRPSEASYQSTTPFPRRWRLEVDVATPPRAGPAASQKPWRLARLRLSTAGPGAPHQRLLHVDAVPPSRPSSRTPGHETYAFVSSAPDTQPYHRSTRRDRRHDQSPPTASPRRVAPEATRSQYTLSSNDLLVQFQSKAHSRPAETPSE